MQQIHLKQSSKVRGRVRISVRLTTIILIFLAILSIGYSQDVDLVKKALQETEQNLKQANLKHRIFTFDQLKKIVDLLFADPIATYTEVGAVRNGKKKIEPEVAALKTELQKVLSESEVLFIISNFYLKKGFPEDALRCLEEAKKLAPSNILITQTFKELKEARDKDIKEAMDKK